MWQRWHPTLTHLGPTGGMGREGRREKGRKRESFRERSSTLSLIFLAIGPMVYGGARGKVHPRGKTFSSRPESRSFDKTARGRDFLLLGLVFG